MNTTYHRLTFAEREQISQGIYAHENFSDIAKRIKFEVSSVTREVHGNVKRKRWSYSAVKAQVRAEANNKKKGRSKKLSTNEPLKNYVYEKLKLKWSPEEIARRIEIDYPQDMTMRISHETIYQHIYCLAKGELKKELMQGLRRERKLRQPRKYAHSRKPGIRDIISISERPDEAKDRIVPGHWEGDLIIGKGRNSAMGTLVERTTRLTLLVPLEKKDAFSVRTAMAKAFKRIPKQFRKTLTYDRGTEMAQHLLFTDETKIQVYFADPYSPWQRGTNENTNGLIRQYFPKGTDFRNVAVEDIHHTEAELNGRPRKILGFATPSEKFYQLITHKSLR